MVDSVQAFVDKWVGSGGAERANKDAFLIELCDALEVPRPAPSTGDNARDLYVFEKDAVMPHSGGAVTLGKMDLFKAGCFVLEAKQGSEPGAKKVGSAKRKTAAWDVAMKNAYGQALGYARTLDKSVPFVIACDIGYCFDLYAAFDGSRDYRPFPDPRSRLRRLRLAPGSDGRADPRAPRRSQRGARRRRAQGPHPLAPP